MRDLRTVDLKGLRILLRADLNVPMLDGHVIDHTRINQIIPTIEFLKNGGAKIILISHLGRPKGRMDNKYSLKFLSPILEEAYKTKVHFASGNVNNGEILLLENIRFNAGEEANDIEFAKILSRLADIFVNDAFSCCHRAHASICGITKFLPSYPGFALSEELANLEQSMDKNLSPKVVIIAGLKVSTKFKVLTKLIASTEHLIIGGAMANTFLQAIGCDMKESFVEIDFLAQAKEFYHSHKDKIILPIDLVCEVAGEVQTFDIDKLPPSAKALDVGPKSVAQFTKILKASKLVLWNGPLGYYEDPRFSKASLNLARAIVEMPDLRSIVGGGDTVAAIGKFSKQFSYLSSSGGAFLEWLENSDLPGLQALRINKNSIDILAL